jgi:RNA:NAD 2'-phosphotransferase (TPT1/KptA family)
MTVDEDQLGFSTEKAEGKNDKQSQTRRTKLRGTDHDSPTVRISKTLSWLLRHVADSEGLEMRGDGYVKVSEMVIPTCTKLVLPGVNFSYSSTTRN